MSGPKAFWLRSSGPAPREKSKRQGFALTDRSGYIRARIVSVRHALAGIATLLATQPNARLHAVATVVVTIIGLYAGLNANEWCWIVLAAALVWVAEALNTALEFLTDLASPAFHPLAGKAKDVAAGAVLIAASAALVIGAVILVPRLIEKII